MASLILEVDGMTCAHCEATVRRAIESIDGVESADVSLEQRRAEVEFSADLATVEQIVHAVDQAGYSAHAI